MEFWGVEVKAGHPFKVEIEPGRIIHISEAALGEQKEGKGCDLIPLFVEINGKKYVMGSLSSENIPQVTFDLFFEKDFVLSHGAKNGSIYFCGYFTANHFLKKEMPGFDSDDSSDEDIPEDITENGKGEAKLEEVKPSAADVRHLYKNRLQIFAQKKNLKMPEYSCQREGPYHASRFYCNVTVDGKTYGGSEFYYTVKEAEHAAAKLAWDSLAANETQQEDCGLYKNLLQELAQKRGLCIPEYEATESGPRHMPSFLSIVKVGGQCFQGEATKSKKQAEIIAAKVAYYGLINGENEGKLSSSQRDGADRSAKRLRRPPVPVLVSPPNLSVESNVDQRPGEPSNGGHFENIYVAPAPAPAPAQHDLSRRCSH